MIFFWFHKERKRSYPSKRRVARQIYLQEKKSKRICPGSPGIVLFLKIVFINLIAE